MSVKTRALFQQPPKLIDRYLRLKARTVSLEISQSVARWFMRPRLKWRERSRRRQIVLAMESVSQIAASSNRHKFYATTAVSNLALFFLIAERDIQTLKVDALTHPDPWKRSLCARVILLTIHELDFRSVAGRQLTEALTAAKVPENFRRSLERSLRSIRQSQEKARSRFHIIRNSTIAHRNPDALAQYRAICNLDPIIVMREVADFYAGARALNEVLPDLLRYLTGTHGVTSQLRPATTTV